MALVLQGIVETLREFEIREHLSISEDNGNGVVRHCSSTGRLSAVVTRAQHIVHHIAEQIERDIAQRDNRGKQYPWLDMVLFINAARNNSLTAHSTAFKWRIERAGFMAIVIWRQRIGSVSDDLGFLRASVTNRKAVGDAIWTSHTESNVVIAN